MLLTKTEAEELLKEGKVQFDFFKYPSIGIEGTKDDLSKIFSTIERIRKLKPILYHGLFPNYVNICDQQFQTQFDISAFRNICEKTMTP